VISLAKQKKSFVVVLTGNAQDLHGYDEAFTKSPDDTSLYLQAIEKYLKEHHG
jgi:hypothetical protein